MRANTFEYDGTTWTREREWTPVMSNTGKSVVDSTEIFRGADGSDARANPDACGHRAPLGLWFADTETPPGGADGGGLASGHPS